MQKIVLISILLSCLTANAEVGITILQTSDLHSHFQNTDSPFKLGGVARLASKIKEIKAKNKNVLVLDAGDFTEGSIFFVNNSGESTHRIMESIGYDAVVLGNHDWLIGPTELYNSLNNSKFSVPILSANLDFKNLDPKIALSNYIKPYLIKEVDGVKVGILGLSTFQLIFDGFFAPVSIINPMVLAQKMVDELRQVQGCQVVIVLSHLGFNADKNLAQKIKGVDLIVGGHSHILLKTPAVYDGVPVTHVGKWGQYLGQIDLVYNSGKTSISNYKVHQIEQNLEEDSMVKAYVDGAIVAIENKWGSIFHDVVLKSDVDLPIKDYRSDNIMGHWVADSLREFTHSDVAFENPSYASRDIFRGETSAADVFSIFPHIYNPVTNKAWTIKTFDITGLYVKLLVSGVFRSGLYLKMSNAKVILDLSKTLNQVAYLEVGGAPIDPLKTYKLAGTNGILEAVEFLKNYGIDIGIGSVTDTGFEAWRVAAEFLRSKSPITPEKIKWEGRIRTLQPDVVVLPEELTFDQAPASSVVHIKFNIRNSGYMSAKNVRLRVGRANQPGDTLSDRNVLITQTEFIPFGEILGGQTKFLDIPWDVSSVMPGRYAVQLELPRVEDEMETENNILTTYVDVYEN